MFTKKKKTTISNKNVFVFCCLRAAYLHVYKFVHCMPESGKSCEEKRTKTGYTSTKISSFLMFTYNDDNKIKVNKTISKQII